MITIYAEQGELSKWLNGSETTLDITKEELALVRKWQRTQLKMFSAQDPRSYTLLESQCNTLQDRLLALTHLNIDSKFFRTQWAVKR